MGFLLYNVFEQEEEMLGETGEMQPLARYIQIRDDSMKDLEVQLVDPKDTPDTKCLTQSFTSLGKVPLAESQNQETPGKQRQQ